MLLVAQRPRILLGKLEALDQRVVVAQEKTLQKATA
jgi:hypothetical protein